VFLCSTHFGIIEISQIAVWLNGPPGGELDLYDNPPPLSGMLSIWELARLAFMFSSFSSLIPF
jgi:hypothetical protein